MELFADDGCVLSNIATKTYDVTVVGRCEHTKVRKAVITVDAQTAADAVSFVQTWLRIPLTHVQDVTLGQ